MGQLVRSGSRIAFSKIVQVRSQAMVYLLHIMAVGFVTLILIRISFWAIDFIFDKFHLILCGIVLVLLAYWGITEIDQHNGWGTVRLCLIWFGMGLLALGIIFAAMDALKWFRGFFKSLNRSRTVVFSSDLQHVQDLSTLVGLHVEHPEHGPGEIMKVFDGRLLTYFFNTNEKWVVPLEKLRRRKNQSDGYARVSIRDQNLDPPSAA
jgi:hypothetical protein